MNRTALIRPMQLGEIERIQALERDSASRFRGTDFDAVADDEPTAARTLEARIRTGDALVAVDREDAAIAFVICRPLGPDIYIEQIDVASAHAGKRLGAALIGMLADRDTALVLSTLRDIPWNAPWYRRLGFVDLPDDPLPPLLQQIRNNHIARGMDETQRVFMRRGAGPLGAENV